MSHYRAFALPWVPEVLLACGGNFRCWPKADTSSSSKEINFPVLMSIWPEGGLLISDKHPLFLFMSVVFFGECSS